MTFWKDKVVLVTGADGFAGSHLCRALIRKGAKVKALVRPGRLKNVVGLRDAQIVTGDVLDYQSLLNVVKGADVCFHLAAITLIPETRAVIMNTFGVNAGGTLNVLLAAKELEVKKFVYVSTSHVYGKQDNFPIREENSPAPIDIYSASKLAGEHLCYSFFEMYHTDILISRAFNHFGPGQREEFLIPTIITKLVKNERLTLGNPNSTRDYTYVDDIIEGYLLLAEKGKAGRVYQFCSGEERSVKDIVETLIRIGGFRAEPEWNPRLRKVDIPRSFGSNSRAEKELGWHAKVSFEEGIRRTIEHFSSKALKPH